MHEYEIWWIKGMKIKQPDILSEPISNSYP